MVVVGVEPRVGAEEPAIEAEQLAPGRAGGEQPLRAVPWKVNPRGRSTSP
jgi:hypothetical protein